MVHYDDMHKNVTSILILQLLPNYVCEGWYWHAWILGYMPRPIIRALSVFLSYIIYESMHVIRKWNMHIGATVCLSIVHARFLTKEAYPQHWTYMFLTHLLPYMQSCASTQGLGHKSYLCCLNYEPTMCTSLTFESIVVCMSGSCNPWLYLCM